MAAFLLWFAFWLAGSTFGPVKYHPDTPPPVVAHEAESGDH
jgi:hypothetical protein